MPGLLLDPPAPLRPGLADPAGSLTLSFTPYVTPGLQHDSDRRLMRGQLLPGEGLFVLPMLTGREMLLRGCAHPVRVRRPSWTAAAT